jgi:hypothetical protein
MDLFGGVQQDKDFADTNVFTIDFKILQSA